MQCSASMSTFCPNNDNATVGANGTDGEVEWGSRKARLTNNGLLRPLLLVENSTVCMGRGGVPAAKNIIIKSRASALGTYSYSYSRTL